MQHLFGILNNASYVCVIKPKCMSIIPSSAQQLLTEQSVIESKLKELEGIINNAARGAMGITLDSSKTSEWKEAKTLYSIYWASLRAVNVKLSKIRKAVGYEAINGKRVTIYQYK